MMANKNSHPHISKVRSNDLFVPCGLGYAGNNIKITKG